ncbi:MAG: hypothetical protein QW273_02900 [Candidatus Pacearchaeota archaeon]
MKNAHLSPITKFIVFNLIREVHYEKFKKKEKEVIDTSIIPTVTTKNKLEIPIILDFHKKIPLKIISDSPKKNFQLQEKEKKPEEKVSSLEDFQESLLHSNRDNKNLEKPKVYQEIITQPKNFFQQKNNVPFDLLRNPPFYGKLTPIIKDPNVTMIECPGPNKPLFVFIGNTKRLTSIKLSVEEINSLLEGISKRTRVPLVSNGVYRVSWDNYIINAIVSPYLEPSFVIKKI